MDKMKSVNSEKLKKCRERYLLSIREVETKLKLNENELKKYEEGEDFPTYSKLFRLANFYNKPVFYFFTDENPNEELISFDRFEKVSFRALSDLSIDINQKRIREQIEQAALYRFYLSEIYKHADVFGTKKTFYEHLSDDNMINASDDVFSDWLRKKIGISLEDQKRKFTSSSQLLEAFRAELYKLGIYVFKDSFRDLPEKISGLCLYDEERKYPIVLLNNKNTFGRQLFTLFHEIYHLFRGKSDIDSEHIESIESECNQFASMFLMPEDDFKKETAGICSGNFDLKKVEEISTLYSVSKAAVMYRLKTDGKISPDQYQSATCGYSDKRKSSGNGGNYYSARISYLGKSYLNDVFNLYYVKKIPMSRLTVYTGMRASNIPTLASNMPKGD